MLSTVGQNLKSHWRPLVATDLIFKAIAFTLLTPVIGLLFQGFLSISGRTVLADTDIAKFLLHPIGWLAVIVVGAAIICVLALEQSVLMTISLACRHDRQMSVSGSFRFVFQHVAGIFQVAAKLVGKLLLLSAPFLAVGGVLFAIFLTEYDINYYLTEKPSQFWMAVVCIGTVLVVLTALLIRCVVNWSVAIQLYLFEAVPPKDCLKTSLERVTGHRKTICKWVILWLVVNAAISSLMSGIVVWLGSELVPGTVNHVWILVMIVGMVLAMWALVNLGTSLLAVISFALMQAEIYDRFGKSDSCVIPSDDATETVRSFTLSSTRTVCAFVIAVLVAALVGLTAIHSVRLDDDLQVTAHRGASGKAPENTLAAVMQAIEDGADWVEIDVQESKDGVVLVAHDSDLMKVAGVSTKIWEGTAEELQAIDVGSYLGSEFKDERVPRLSDVLKTCRGKVGLNIELKYYGHDQNLEQRVVDLVEQFEMESDVVIMSLKAQGIQEIKALRPEWTVGLLTAVKVGDLTKVKADFLAVNSKLATRSFIRSAHDQGKQVYAWTLNDPVTMSTMISRGVDNVITDHPEMARRVLDERAEMSPVERVLVEFAFLFGAVSKGSEDQ